MENADYTKVHLNADLLKVFDEQAEAQAPITTYEALQARDKEASAKVNYWIKEGGPGREDCRHMKLLTPVRPLPPLQLRVECNNIATFMDSLVAKLTEVLVDHPDMRTTISEILAHTTTVIGRVEKAKRLVELSSNLSSLLAGRTTANEFKSFIVPLLPSQAIVQMDENTSKRPYKEISGGPAPQTEEADDDDDDEEYDPFAAFDSADIHQPSHTMKPNTTLYLPPPTGRSSCQLTSPATGPSHSLCRVWFQKPSDWTNYKSIGKRCQTMRVLLVKRRKTT
eukprot:TRINITY_DN565_c0_g1_i3.p1 TRINITY_DN565_c0_g1~~TRINITY_DN565_c0_g1_i3.p1  ORF type:complete len:281 (+),score=29.26 TRINITY_DN565_c0_g1_i3:82-924(+)